MCCANNFDLFTFTNNYCRVACQSQQFEATEFVNLNLEGLVALQPDTF